MTDNLIVSTNKLSSLMKMTKWHTHVVHRAKHMKVVGALDPPLPTSGTDQECVFFGKWPMPNREKLICIICALRFGRILIPLCTNALRIHM